MLTEKPVGNPRKNHHTVETLSKQLIKMLFERFSDKNKLSKNNLTNTDKKCYRLLFKAQRSSPNKRRQRQGNCYPRRKRLYCKG